MKVIVTGSLGHISKPLTKELVEKGHKVTVISSNAERKNDIEALGATAAIGTIEDKEFLASTFAGADAAYIMVPPNFTVPDMRVHSQEIGNNYARAIQKAGVKRVVHLSSIGADLDKGTGFILGARDVEGILDKLTDVAITHLRPGYFYYNLYNFVDMIKGMGIIGANYGDNDKIILAHPQDIAAVAVEEIETPAAGKKVRYIASDERTANEIARIIGSAIGKPDLKWVTFTDEQTQGALEQRGTPVHIAANFVELGSCVHSGAIRQDYERNRPATLGKVKVEDFAKEFAAAF